MRVSRFLLLSTVLFFVCFWWAGGDFVADHALGKINETVQENVLTSPELSDAAGTLSSVYARTYRIFALQSAVDKAIKTKNYAQLDRICLPMQQAIIAVEDNRFYTHHGFDITAILRATLVNLQYGHIEEGASTITQQLVKNLFLTEERSMSRKAEEFLLSVNMELRYPKEKILELYLNTIYFGSGYYGITEAAMGYFAKMPSELTLAEASILAGLPNAPSLYSPYVNFRAAKERQSIVLETMVKYGYLNPSIAEETKREEVRLVH